MRSILFSHILLGWLQSREVRRRRYLLLFAAIVLKMCLAELNLALGRLNRERPTELAAKCMKCMDG